MILSAWHLWMIAAIFLLILEIFSADFLFAAFAVACFGAGIAASLGAEITAQTGVFVICAIFVLAVIRPAFKRYLYRRSDPRKTNVDAMIGRVGTVLEPTGSEDAPGRVRLGGEEWRAVSESTDLFDSGERVEVAAVSGSTLTVRRPSQ